MVKATLVFSSKFYIVHRTDDLNAVVEMKIFQIPVCSDYPEGIKYSLFCVDIKTNYVFIGIDNHRPKGHHFHKNEQETVYFFRGPGALVDDFYDEIRQAGFIL